MYKFFSIIFLLLMVGLESNATNCYFKEVRFKEQMFATDGVQTQPQVPLKSNLVLTILPSETDNTLPMVFLISGDGGWASFVQGVSEILSKKGMPVIGLNSRKYFWNEKQPKEVADEISEAVKYYMKQWNRNSFILIGYSFGACVTPFIVPELNSSLKGLLKGIYCFSPDETGDFKIHITDLLNFNTTQKYDVLNQMKIIKAWNPICIFGGGETLEKQDRFSKEGIHVEIIPGAHHYDNDYKAVTDIIFKDFIKQNP